MSDETSEEMEARAEFENWCINEGHDILKAIAERSTNTADLQLGSAWEAWKAGAEKGFDDASLLAREMLDLD